MKLFDPTTAPRERTVEVLRVVELLEAEFGRSAIKEMAPMQPGDVAETCADVDDLMRDVGFRPATPIEDGIRHFAAFFPAIELTHGHDAAGRLRVQHEVDAGA